MVFFNENTSVAKLYGNRHKENIQSGLIYFALRSLNMDVVCLLTLTLKIEMPFFANTEMILNVHEIRISICN